MKLIRYRKPSIKTALGITKAKRRIAKVTGIPTTKSGRKRKVVNTLTGGTYSKYQRTRAKITKPYRALKRSSSCMGLLIQVLSILGIILYLL